VAGEMWVGLYNEDPAAPASYLVVDANGKAIGQISMPVGVTPFAIGRDYVLGVRRDEDGLEHIVQYTLQRR
jgi:hypothetical protein